MPIIPLGIPLDLLSGREEERSDYRRMPASDTGETYVDQGYLGWYTPSAEPFEAPEVRRFAGYGATEEDLERGWSEPRITNNPAYELANYKDRWSEPKVADLAKGDFEAIRSDMEFRGRNRQSRGLMTRPRIPIDRG